MRVFLGYDSRQPIACQVLAHSLWRASSIPLSITRLDLRTVPLTRRGLTEFTYSRFLVPWLSGFEGVSIFMDSDMLCLADPTELLAYPLAYPQVPVFVVKGAQRFEWSSLMVFNSAQCRMLTPEYVADEASPLMKFGWAETIGELPAEWNHCVGYDAPNPQAKLVHFTMGIPIWPETINSPFRKDWQQCAKESMGSVSFEALMGNSVHVPRLKQLRDHAAV